MTSSRHATATVTTPADREIHIERVFDAPRDRVFAAYTDPALIPEWWGPHGTTTIVDKMDVAGRRQLAVRDRDSDGSETGFRGTYREVTPPERIVQTFEWEACPATCRSRPPTFEDLGDRTKVTTVSIFHTTEERDGMLGSGMEGGLNETYERLDELLGATVGVDNLSGAWTSTPTADAQALRAWERSGAGSAR